MLILIKLLTTLLLPPFNSLILLGVAGFFRLFNHTKLSRYCTLLSITLLYLFSTPFFSQKLLQAVISQPHFTLDEYRQAQAIVVLGGGVRNSDELFNEVAIDKIPLERLRYAVYLQKETALPLLVTGGSPEGRVAEADVMASELGYFFNITPQWIENRSNTTEENARYTAQILRPQGINKIVLVTNNWHLKRATKWFEQQGFEVMGAAVGARIEFQWGIFAYIPQASALQQSAMALKEGLGLLKP